MSGDDKPEIIHPPSHVNEKVDMSAGGIDHDTLAQAEAVIAGMADAYLEWVEGDLEKLQDLCSRAQAAEAAERRPLLQEIFSVSHDVKGQGGSFGYDLMTEIGNQLCRYIERLGDEVRDSHMAVVKVHIDAMRVVISRRMSGDGGADGSNLLRGLHAAVVKTQP